MLGVFSPKRVGLGFRLIGRRRLNDGHVLWNTVQIEHVMGRPMPGQRRDDWANLAYVWALQYIRIIPNGTYFLGWPQSKAFEMASA